MFGACCFTDAKQAKGNWFGHVLRGKGLMTTVLQGMMHRKDGAEQK